MGVLRAMFTRAATRAARMSRRAARLLGKPVTALKQYTGELLKHGNAILEGLMRKASKSNPNQSNVSKATSLTSHAPITTPSMSPYNSRRRDQGRV